MKQFFTLTMAMGLLINVNAQPAKDKKTEPAKEETCLEAYQKAFNERGAYPVEDGTYKNVVVTIYTAKSGETECFAGKAKVESSNVTAIYISYEDNTYDYLDRKYKNDNKAKINNGITEALVTDTGDRIYVIFPEKIKPKKKQFKKVTGPDKNF